MILFFFCFTYALNISCHKLSRVKNDSSRKERTPRKSKQSFKHEITLIAQCVNIEIQYMTGWGKNTLINDVWCGFTNYIFQAFKRETRLIAEESSLNVAGEKKKKKKKCWFFLSNYDRCSTHKLRELNGSILALNAYWKFTRKRENILFLCFPFFPLFLPIPPNRIIPLPLLIHFHSSGKIKSGEKFRKLLVVWG